jgi:hypothetical protein
MLRLQNAYLAGRHSYSAIGRYRLRRKAGIEGYFP